MTDTHIKINAVTPRVQYTGNGSTTVFPYEFAIFDESDMQVYLDDELQESGYSVSGEGQTEGGNVTFDTAPTNGTKITLLRNIPIERVTDFQEGGTFRPKNLNDEFDRQTAFLQQVSETLGRSVKVGPTSDVEPDAVLGQVERIYSSIDNVDAVADDISNVNTVAGKATEIATVSTNINNVNSVSSNIANVNSVAGNATNINNVAGNKTNINAVAGNATNINNVAGNKNNINTVATNSSNVTTVATNISSVNSCASNMSAITDAPTQAAAAAASAAQAASSAASLKPILFDFKWTDYEVDNMAWLRADTFSWQDGTVYSNAYNHLVADYNGGTSQTETVGSYTITYVLADDGHKITTDETNVANIYSESGVAWYYVLDTTNQRFKLPRTKYGFTGLRDTVGKYVPETLPNVTGTNGFGGTEDYISGCFKKTTGQNAVYGGSSGAGRIRYDFDASLSSSAYQNNAPVQQRATQMYLYFYVGQFSQSAIEQTAGLNASLFNGKADVDLSNAASNASASAKEIIVGWGIPDYSSGTSRSWDTSYYADKNTAVFYNTIASTGDPNVKPQISYDNSNWIVLYYHNAGPTSNLEVAGWFVCPKGCYWKVVGGHNLDRDLISYVMKGES